MDANGSSFRMLAGARDFVPTEVPARLAFDTRRATWRLASSAPEPATSEDEALAVTLRERARDALDTFGSEARVLEEADQRRVLVRHRELPEAEILRSNESIHDLTIGLDGVIFAVVGSALWVRHAGTLGDSREPFQRIDRALLGGDHAPESLSAWRLAPRPSGGVWVLDREHAQLAFCSGRPARHRPEREEEPGTFRPRPEAPTTLSLRLVDAGQFGGDVPVAIACSSSGRVAVLGWRDAGFARVHLLDAHGVAQQRLVLRGLRRPFSLAFIDDDRIAVLVTERRGEAAARVSSDAVVYGVPTQAELSAQGLARDERSAEELELLPRGERYPLRGHDGAALFNSPLATPSYGSERGARRLLSLSLQRRATRGAANGAQPLDSGGAGTCWHRLYLEAHLPAGCGIALSLAASDSLEPPHADAFYPHHFGEVPGSAPPVPRAAWVAGHSEIPFAAGLLPCTPELGRSGLFTVLIQRAGRRTRRLLGRYLHVRATFHGTGQASPELAALRAWTPRFSYVRQYLPELYHEEPLLEADDASDEPRPSEPATGADFLERFVSSFEGVLTPLEDRVAAAWQLSNPRSAPAAALEWLASWVGVTFDPGLPERVQRKLLYFSPELASERGTRRGLERALEIITEGGISRGDVVLIEDYRLKRTWATILGADLADEDDELLGGLVVNANSIVGETLVLGDEQRREFLALFGSRAEETSADAQATREFFADSAHRATVLCFEALGTETIGRVRRLVERERPAHVEVAVKSASQSFIVAISALVGIDTRLAVELPPSRVTLGYSRLGMGDRVERTRALHPGLEGGAE